MEFHNFKSIKVEVEDSFIKILFISKNNTIDRYSVHMGNSHNFHTHSSRLDLPVYLENGEQLNISTVQLQISGPNIFVLAASYSENDIRTFQFELEDCPFYTVDPRILKSKAGKVLYGKN